MLVVPQMSTPKKRVSNTTLVCFRYRPLPMLSLIVSLLHKIHTYDVNNNNLERSVTMLPLIYEGIVVTCAEVPLLINR